MVLPDKGWDAACEICEECFIFFEVSINYSRIAIAGVLRHHGRSITRTGNQKMRHIISILMSNEAGALARVVALFSSRGYNIESLSVAPTEDSEVSRLTLVTRGSDHVIEQINNQLLKLVDVVNTADMTRDDHFERELLLMKVKVQPGAEQALPELIKAAGARVLNDCPETYTLELTATNDRMDEFISQVSGCAEILAVVRSGAMAIARGENVLSAEL
jgi:acetolactate synthase-1/3 small subunit